jgi:hypothetical protein
MLILDDLGKEYRSDRGYIERILESLIRERHNAKRATVLTANGSVVSKDGASIYSTSMIDALKASAYPVPVGGHDYREAEAAEISAAMAPG